MDELRKILKFKKKRKEMRKEKKVESRREIGEKDLGIDEIEIIDEERNKLKIKIEMKIDENKIEKKRIKDMDKIKIVLIKIKGEIIGISIEKRSKGRKRRKIIERMKREIGDKEIERRIDRRKINIKRRKIEVELGMEVGGIWMMGWGL